jgi:hypothetical protein
MENSYAQEAQERWGETEAYRQSQRRTASYDQEDWDRIKAEADSITRRFAELLAAGEPAGGPAATGLAEEHRRHIGLWFYDCSKEMHRGLGDMYVDDPRFTANYDAVAPGLARYIRDAIHATA